MNDSFDDFDPPRRRRRRRRRRRVLASVAVAPALMTLGNLLCGFTAVFYASRSSDIEVLGHFRPISVAAALIFGGMIFDALDGGVARLTRSSMLQVLSEDYITTARAKGALERRVISVHALRNAFIPVLTLLGVQTSWLLGGAGVTEIVFARPGLGTMAVDAIRQMDFPVLQAVVLIAALTYTFVNLLVDVLNVAIDPRISYD